MNLPWELPVKIPLFVQPKILGIPRVYLEEVAQGQRLLSPLVWRRLPSRPIQEEVSVSPLRSVESLVLSEPMEVCLATALSRWLPVSTPWALSLARLRIRISYGTRCKDMILWMRRVYHEKSRFPRISGLAPISNESELVSRKNISEKGSSYEHEKPLKMRKKHCKTLVLNW